ncbi:MAG: hypothetical protein AAFV29_09345, partial [Myxococcota bacterium]
LCVASQMACSAGLADLRPDSLKERGPSSEQSERGRRLLERAAQLTGGRALWRTVETYEISARDVWDHWLAELMILEYDSDQKFELWAQNPGLSNVKMTLQNGARAGEVWGYENDRFYLVKDGVRDDSEDPIKVLFVKSLAAVIALPIRLSYADQVAYVGDIEFEGQTYHQVFATWSSMEPSADYDHWMVWINAESGLVEQCEFTVREYERAVTFPLSRTGAFSMTDYRRIDGFMVPRKVAALFALGDEPVHVITVDSVQFNQRVPAPRGVGEETEVPNH